MALEPNTQLTAIKLGLQVGKLFGGLFDDIDYPWVVLSIRVDKGYARILVLKELDDVDLAPWRKLGNDLVNRINAQITSLNLGADRSKITAFATIGKASGRPGAFTGNGFFVHDNQVALETTPKYKNIKTLAQATKLFFDVIDQWTTRTALKRPIFNTPPQALAVTKKLETKIKDKVSEGNKPAQELIIDFENNTALPIVGVTGQLLDTSNVVTNKLIQSNENLTSELTGVIDALTNKQQITIQNNINNDLSFLDSVTDKITDLIGTNLDGIFRVLDVLTDKLGNADVSLTDALKDIANAETLNGKAISESILKVIDAVLRPSAGIAEALPDDVGEKAKEAISDVLLPDHLKDMDFGDAARELSKQIAESLELSDEACHTIFSDITDDTPIINVIASLLTSFFTLAYMPMLVVAAKSQRCMLEWNYLNPTRILDPADAINSLHRKLITKDEADIIIRKQGYSERDTNTLISSADLMPDDTITFSMWLRGLITEEDAKRILRSRGYTDEVIDKYKELRFFIPPVQDLITMAVREVFSPEIAKEFGQFDDFPDDFAVWAKRQGVSEQWSKNYWAAHWALPSIQMGYEMLHRGVINEDKLKLLMRALDIMPGWRDDLIEISFSPYTRVDIRRMHKVGVLTREEVFKAYKDIGYNDERAEKLTSFTEELNSDGNILDVTDISELTRSNILAFYKDGVINRAVAYGMLLQVGFDIATAELWLTDVDMREELKERKEDANLIVTQAKTGVITFGQANDTLNGMGLSSAEITKYQRQLLQAESAANKLPSKTDIDKMLEAAIITEAEYTDTMRKIGYSDVWIDRYIKLNNVVEEDDKTVL